VQVKKQLPNKDLSCQTLQICNGRLDSTYERGTHDNRYKRTRDCPHTKAAALKTAVPALALHSFSKAIEIPARLRNQPLDVYQTSARLTAVLSRSGVRVLGDLHGRRVVDFAWEKNCGPKTLYELDLLTRRARFRNGNTSGGHNGHGSDHPSHIPSRFSTRAREAVPGKIHEDAATFVVPPSICHLSFNELPVTTRLANVVRSIGADSLGDLNGRDAFELLQYKACGWGTISQIQQLVERAISGEFDVGEIVEATAAAELLRLLEEGLAKLPLRDRQFVLARIGAEKRIARSPGAVLLCLSYAEIGRRYGLTRARVHKVFGNMVDSLRKIWGPRVPRLLEVIKWRCLSKICPLTPQLLEQWTDSRATSSARPVTPAFCNAFRLPMEAHVRLIASLDKGIPCWPATTHKPRRINASTRQFDLAFAQIVREAGGHISVAEAYRRLSHPGRRDYRRLTIQNFLCMLQSDQCTVVEFKDPETPIVLLRLSKGASFVRGIASENGKPSTARKIHSSSPSIRLFEPSVAFCERRAAAGH
jgi:hypothetical protein